MHTYEYEYETEIERSVILDTIVLVFTIQH